MYALLVIISGIFGWFFYQPHNRQQSRFSSFVYFVLWTIIFVTIAFRADIIGSDTRNYLNKYLSIGNSASYFSFGGIGTTEPLFFYLNRFLTRFFGEWSQCIVLVEGIVVAFCYGHIIKEYSINPILSVLAFLAFGLYLSSLCLLRQYLAMSMCVFSLKYVFERKPTLFYACTLVATGLHYTAVFWIIVYFLCVNIARGKRRDYIFIIIAIVGYFYVEYFQEAASQITERWNAYSEIESGAEGTLSFIMFLLITVLALFYRDFIRSNYQYGSEILYLNYINMIFWTMRLVTRNAERLSFYFTIAPILLVPILCDVIDKRFGSGTGHLFRALVVTCMAFMFVYKYTHDASVFPYQFMSLNR